MLLILLYFTDYQGGLVASALFALVSSAATVISLFFSKVYFGFGFILGCAVFFLAVYIRLEQFTRRLPYYILSRQPLVEEINWGCLQNLDIFLMVRERRKNFMKKRISLLLSVWLAVYLLFVDAIWFCRKMKKFRKAVRI